METNRPNRTQKNQGMNWITQHKRLAIYIRDGFACAYCGLSVEIGTKLTLDHLEPYSQGGSISDEKNLVTCCHTCNSTRGDRKYTDFANDTAQYLNHGIKGSDIVAHIKDCIGRGIDTKEAKKLVALRGSCFKVLESRICM